MPNSEKKINNSFCEEYEPNCDPLAPPLTNAELKERLKHIAGLCYGLLCDIGNMEIETAETRAKVKESVKRIAGQCYGLVNDIKYKEEEGLRELLIKQRKLRRNERERARIAKKKAAEEATKADGVKERS